MSRATIGQVLNLVLEVQHQMHQGFHDVDLKILASEQRLTTRIDDLQEQINELRIGQKELRITQIEDSRAIREVLVDHGRRLVRLEKRAASH